MHIILMAMPHHIEETCCCHVYSQTISVATSAARGNIHVSIIKLSDFPAPGQYTQTTRVYGN